MRPTVRDVVTRLVDERAISSDDAALFQRTAAGLKAAHASAPWYVRLLSAVGAWLAAALFCWFLFVVDVFDSGVASLVVGAGLIGASCVARRRVRHDVLVQGCIALAVVGECLVLAGGAELFHWKEETTALVAVALNVAVLLAFADPVGRFLAAAFAVASVSYVAHEVDHPVAYQLAAALIGAAAVAVWEARAFKSALWRQVRAPLGVALAGGLLGMLSWDLAENWNHAQSLSWVATAGLGVASAALVIRIFLEQGGLRASVPLAAALAGVGLFGAASWSTPGLLAAALVLALGYHRREVLLIGMASVFLVAFTGWYYYSLHITLLQKAAALILSGGVLLALRWWIRRPAPAASPQGASA